MKSLVLLVPVTVAVFLAAPSAAQRCTATTKHVCLPDEYCSSRGWCYGCRGYGESGYPSSIDGLAPPQCRCGSHASCTSIDPLSYCAETKSWVSKQTIQMCVKCEQCKWQQGSDYDGTKSITGSCPSHCQCSSSSQCPADGFCSNEAKSLTYRSSNLDVCQYCLRDYNQTSTFQCTASNDVDGTCNKCNRFKECSTHAQCGSLANPVCSSKYQCGSCALCENHLIAAARGTAWGRDSIDGLCPSSCTGWQRPSTSSNLEHAFQDVIAFSPRNGALTVESYKGYKMNGHDTPLPADFATVEADWEECNNTKYIPGPGQDPVWIVECGLIDKSCDDTHYTAALIRTNTTGLKYWEFQPQRITYTHRSDSCYLETLLIILLVLLIVGVLAIVGCVICCVCCCCSNKSQQQPTPVQEIQMGVVVPQQQEQQQQPYPPSEKV